jgi:hypothetical protein
MASVDKIYGTTEQYDEFYKWMKEHRPRGTHYFYPRDGYEDPSNRPITNFTTGMDMWVLEMCLSEVCPLGWVRTRIQEQYDLGHLPYNDLTKQMNVIKMMG